jgi:hypothetical protein
VDEIILKICCLPFSQYSENGCCFVLIDRLFSLVVVLIVSIGSNVKRLQTWARSSISC